ncbi:delta(1)-pyrroline-2-carboxylate reductase 2-like [Hydra vulgaris]
MCYSIPYSNSRYLTADFATTIVSRGKIYEHAKKNLNIPYDLAVDREGNPTNDRYKALKGGLCLFDNGYKSFVISLLISILGGPLIGGLVNHKVNGTKETDNPPKKGDLFIEFNIASFTDLYSFYIKVKSFLNEIKKDKSEMRIP